MFSFELPKATFHDTGDNETALDGEPGFDDPVKHRLGAFISKIYGIISGDRLRGKSREEKTMLQFRENERFPGKDGGMFRFFGQRPGTNDDRNMVPLLDVATDFIEFHVPVRGLSGGSEMTHDIWAPNGMGVTQMNNDGNFVCYRLERPFDKGRFKATFSSDTGVIPVDQQKWEGV